MQPLCDHIYPFSFAGLGGNYGAGADMNSANSEGQNPNMSENGATMQGNANHDSQMHNAQSEQEPQQHAQQNSQTVTQSGDQDMLSNHNSGQSGLPGVVGMEANDVDRNDVTGMNSNLYPPSSVSGDETGKICSPQNKQCPAPCAF